MGLIDNAIAYAFGRTEQKPKTPAQIAREKEDARKSKELDEMISKAKTSAEKNVDDAVNELEQRQADIRAGRKPRAMSWEKRDSDRIERD